MALSCWVVKGTSDLGFADWCSLPFTHWESDEVPQFLTESRVREFYHVAAETLSLGSIMFVLLYFQSPPGTFDTHFPLVSHKTWGPGAFHMMSEMPRC